MIYKSHIIATPLMILMAALCLLCGFAFAGEGPSTEEQALLELINEARQDPLSMAVSLGMDPDQVIEDLPALKDILIHGLPPLILDEKLYAAASVHTEDMLAKSYFTHESLDGRTPEDRIGEAGYEPSATGESLGMLVFNNFIDPELAVRIIFEKMFRDELDPLRTEKRNILDPELRESGVSVGLGPFNQGGALRNAYLVTCDFAATLDLYAIERGLWRIINEARRSPLEALEKAGVDETSAREALGDHASVLDVGLSPLAWNEKLFESAIRHNRDMLDRYYYNTVSPDGTTPAERIKAAGYDEDAPYAGESLGFQVFEKPEGSAEAVDSFEVARLIFEAMLKKELDPESGVGRNIFNPDPAELGIACGRIVLDAGNPAAGNVYFVVADFARPIEPGFFLIGNVYRDINMNALFDPGEGLTGLSVTVRVRGHDWEWETKSGFLGEYQLRTYPGLLELMVEDEKGSVLAEFSLNMLGQSVGYPADIAIQVDVDGAATHREFTRYDISY